MKKTIILTCALLSAVATAQDLPSTTDLHFGTGTATTLTGGNNYFAWDTTAVGATLENFALTFTINLGANASATADYYMISMGGSNNSASGLTVTLDQTPSQTLNLTNGGTWYQNTSNPAPQIDFTDGGTYTLAVLDGKAYLWAGDEVSQEKFTEGWSLPTGIDATLASGNGGNRVWTTGGKTQVTLVSLTDVSSFSDSVPEPATATLSLLALAGLAARRRRK